ncbi:Fc.00g107620.m01.CDS01 [Cosmosporella sp. VM-42]
MAHLWRSAACALSTFFWAGLTVADMTVFTSYENFTAFADVSHGFPSQTFRSSDIIAPVFQVNTFEEHAVDDAGYLFSGTIYDKKAGPMILDAKDFSLIYADQQYLNTYTSDVQMINGTRYLAFWEGTHTRGHANGRCLVYDENYNLVYNVTALGLHGALADMHELKFTDDGTAIFSTYWNRLYNCSSVGGPTKALLMDSGFQEVDLATNEVIFQWAASDHFAINESYASYSSDYGVDQDSGFDFAHVNSIVKTVDGNYLVSSRHLCSLTLIDGRDGHPIWILGGKNNQFRDLSDGRATDFGWQHDARFYKNQSHITMFDNHIQDTEFCEPGQCKTRGLHLEIDTEAMTVRIVKEYFHPAGINSGAMGGFQTLDNGNVILGWGYNPSFVEFKPDGTPVMDLQRGTIGNMTYNDMFAYRVNKHDWFGRPTWPPSAAVDAPNKTTLNATVYLSWNGATDIAQWAVFASDNRTSINRHESLLIVSERAGFETEIQLGNSTRRYMGAAALSKDGEVLGSTYVIDMANGRSAMMQSDITVDSVYPPPPALPQSLGSDFDFSKLVGAAAVALAVVGAVCYFCRRRPRLGWTDKFQYRRVNTEEVRV